jgi:uncharacterized membrane protein YedE/YeeE
MWPLNDSSVWSGLVCGLMFGWVLESAGFGSPCKLTGQFKLNDWSVLKVMLTAIVVAAAGLAGLQSLGWMEADAVFVPSAMLAAAAIGGLLVGVGFAVGGYCPGTSVVGLFSGRIDAAVFLLGLLAGTWVFADLYGPSIQALMDAAEVMSGDTVSEVLNVSPWWVVLALSAALVGVFVMGQKFERRSQGPITAEQAVAGAQAQH